MLWGWILVSLLFLTGCAEQHIEYAPVTQPLTFVVEEGVPQSSLVFEVSHDGSDARFLHEQAAKRAELNRIRYQWDYQDDEEERLERKKSRNWYSNIDGDIRVGYDVVRDINGEFDEYEETTRSEKYFNTIYRFTVKE